MAGIETDGGRMEPRQTIEIDQWVVGEVLRNNTEATLLGGFCERMVAAGLPLLRAYVAHRALHPIIAAHGFEWRKGEPAVKQEDFDRTMAEAGEHWERSPFFHMIETKTPRMRHRLG